MNTRHTSRWFWAALAAVCLIIFLFSNKASTQTPTPKPDVNIGGGLTTVTFSVPSGRLAVRLPDDMRAGDTISGTVIAEPKGQTQEERAKNQTELNGMVVEINGKIVEPFSAPPAKERESVIQQTFWIYRPDPPKAIQPISSGMATSESGGVAGFSIVLLKDQTSKTELGRINVPTLPSGAVITPDPKTTVPTLPSGAVITPDPKITQPGMTPSGDPLPPDQRITPPANLPLAPKYFDPPLLGQMGRSTVITGPFDGNASNTTLNWTRVRSLVTDFEKNTENVSGGFGLIAESPRKAVFQAPTNVTGPLEITLTEAGKETKGTYRNVGVNLSAPKTNLLRGEKTELRVEVNGLQGLTQPVPLTLTYRGVIVMDGGPYQPLVIQPSQVGADGRYTTTRGITGIQAGGWDATATVVTSRFDFCLRDDSVPARVVLWNTFTGDYLFNCPGCLPGNTPSAEGQQGAGSTSSFSGKGSMVRKGCIITLTHHAPDRRVFATLDPCTSSGSTTVESPATKTKFTITDRNIADNTCP